MAAQIIPFDFESHEVRTLLIDDQPWFFAVDVCYSLNLRDTNKALKGLDDDEKREHEHYSGSGRKPVLINESGLYSLILRSRKTEAKRFKKWVTAEVLPAIRKHGYYSDDQGKMNTLIGQTIGTDGFHVIGALIKGKVARLPINTRRSATSKLWSQLHAAYGVRSAEDIPADQLDSARNFIAAYAIEGEYLPKQDGIQLEPKPNARYLVSFNHKGEQRIDDLPNDACVMTHQELMKAMVTPGDMPVSTEEMFEFTMAALVNLQSRSRHQTNKLREIQR